VGEPLDGVEQRAPIDRFAKEQLRPRRARIGLDCLALVARERDHGQVVRGRLNKQIAADLGIAVATVKQHRGRISRKVGVRSVAELVRIVENATPHQGRIAVDEAGR